MKELIGRSPHADAFLNLTGGLNVFRIPIPEREHPRPDGRLPDVRLNDDRPTYGPKSEAEMNGWCLRHDVERDAARSAERSASPRTLYPQRC
jgi:hypothetical protein